jgi:transposase
VAAGETVYEVNPRWTALGRKAARKQGKTDRLDARAVALFVRQEAPQVPQVFPEDATAILDLLAGEREGAIAEAGRLRNQIHALLLQLDPEYREYFPNLDTTAALDALETYQSGQDPLQQQRAASVRRLAQRLRLAVAQAEDLAGEIKVRAEAGFSPLVEIYGINLLTAGTLAGILGPGHRFANDAELAAHAGVSPLEASSAGIVRHRLNRGGNRRLNAVIYRIALTQVRGWAPAKAYMERRVSEGKTRREAFRALKRYVVRAVWQQWQKCLSPWPGEAINQAA